MAQTERSATSLTYTDSGTAAATIASLQSSIASGAIVRASHINSIITLFNNFLSHYHTYTDLYGIYNFGDGTGNPGYASDPGSSETDNTSVPVSMPSSVSGVSIGNSITAAKYNEAVNLANNLRSHYHTIDDRTS